MNTEQATNIDYALRINQGQRVCHAEARSI